MKNDRDRPLLTKGAAAMALVVIGLLLFLFLSWQVQPQRGGAYIAHRYAANLVDGNGLVYNPGEHVEWPANLLWTLLVALGAAISGFAPRLVAHAVGVLSGMAVLGAIYLYARSVFSASPPWSAAVAPWIVLASTSFAYWSISGTEAPLFAALAVFALAALARGSLSWATAAVCLATLTRPEGLILALVVFGSHLLAPRTQGQRKWIGPLIFGVVVLLLTVFRLAYYGSPLPDSLLAPSGRSLAEGLRELGALLRDGGLLLLIPAGIAVVRERRSWPAAAFAAAMALYTLVSAGDGVDFPRFLLPVIVLLAALSVAGAAAAYRARPYLGLALWILIPLAMSWQVFGGLPSTKLDNSKRVQALTEIRNHHRFFEIHGMRQANLLTARPGTIRLVAVVGLGSFGYYSRLPLLDFFGTIGWELPLDARSTSSGQGAPPEGSGRGRTDGLFARQPDYILIGRRRDDDTTSPLSEIWNHPHLERFYEWDDELRGYRRKASSPASPESDSTAEASSSASILPVTRQPTASPVS